MKQSTDSINVTFVMKLKEKIKNSLKTSLKVRMSLDPPRIAPMTYSTTLFRKGDLDLS